MKNRQHNAFQHHSVTDSNQSDGLSAILSDFPRDSVMLGKKLAVVVLTVFLTFEFFMGIVEGLFGELGEPDQLIVFAPTQLSTTDEEQKKQLLDTLNTLADGSIAEDRIERTPIVIPRNKGKITMEDLEKARFVDAREGLDSECGKLRIFEAA